MKDIIIKTIPIEEQRYFTAGDYWETDSEIHFRVTKQQDKRSEVAILLHEITEFFLTEQHGITEEQITNYDLEWEKRYERGENKSDEPGLEIDCPYRDEHETSLMVEKIYIWASGLDWKKHDEQIIFRQDGIRDKE